MREPEDDDVTVILNGGLGHGIAHVISGRCLMLNIPVLSEGKYRALFYVDSGRRTVWGAQIWDYAGDRIALPPPTHS